ncbi:MAG: hypothetical protein J5I53_10695 [Bradyrhizobiaceae bacterium]|nr:hypothetical protein [Bradyrhizobiaceae bacterium]
MKDIQYLEEMIAPIGIALANKDIASVNMELPIETRIELLKDMIFEAERSLPVRIAEYIYDELLDFKPLSEQEKKDLITKADSIRLPHRLGVFMHPGVDEAIEEWTRLGTPSKTSVLLADVPFDTEVKWQRVRYHILRNDAIAGPILHDYWRHLIDHALEMPWGRSTAQSLIQLELDSDGQEVNEIAVRDQKYNYMEKLSIELSKNGIDTSQFVHSDDAAIVNERLESISVIDLLHALAELFPPHNITGLLVDSGLRELNTLAYKWRVQEKIDLLMSRYEPRPARNAEQALDNSPHQVGTNSSIAGQLMQEHAMSRDEFATWLFGVLKAAMVLSSDMTRATLVELCRAKSGGRLSLRVKGRHLWASRIAEAISSVVHKRTEDFVLRNYGTEIDHTKQKDSLRKAKNRISSSYPELIKLCEQIKRVRITD